MFKIEMSITIERAAEEIFNYVIDLGNYRDWQRGVVEVKQVSSGPLRVGTQINEVRRVLGQRGTSALTITGLQRYSRVAVKSESASVQSEFELQLKPVWGGTQVTLTGQVQPAGMAKVLEPLFARALAGQLHAALERLSKTAEAQAKAGG